MATENTYTNLGSLFTDIADSIRERTGETSEIKACDFPSKIGEINVSNVTIDGKNINENLELVSRNVDIQLAKLPFVYDGCHMFEYNNEVHLIKTSNEIPASYYFLHYKYNSSTNIWEKIIESKESSYSSLYNTSIGSNSIGFTFNGKYHLKCYCGSDYTYKHLIYDGSTWTIYEIPDDKIPAGRIVVFNNKLYAINTTSLSGRFEYSILDENNNSWSSTNTVSLDYTYGDLAIVSSGNLIYMYAIRDAKIYLYSWDGVSVRTLIEGTTINFKQAYDANRYMVWNNDEIHIFSCPTVVNDKGYNAMDVSDHYKYTSGGELIRVGGLTHHPVGPIISCNNTLYMPSYSSHIKNNYGVSYVDFYAIDVPVFLEENTL